MFFFFFKKVAQRKLAAGALQQSSELSIVFFFSEVEISWQNAEKNPCSASEGKHLKQISENVKI